MAGQAERTLAPTTKHRRGRVTRRQAAALEADSPWRIVKPPIDVESAFAGSTAFPDVAVADIGFGTGDVVAALALAEPKVGVLAIDMHTPGIGDLLARLEEEGIDNVRVIDADARIVLSDWLEPGSLVGVRTFFPDPWPKKRHHSRRLVQSSFVELVASRVRPGGFWHLATDWPDYAEQMVEVITANRQWSGGVIERPGWRPVTRYERRAIVAGRESIDLWFVRVCP